MPRSQVVKLEDVRRGKGRGSRGDDTIECGDGISWSDDEKRILVSIFKRLFKIKSVDHYAVGHTDSGFPQFYYINTTNSAAAFYVTRARKYDEVSYILETGCGDVVGHYDNLRVLADDGFRWVPR